KSGQADIGRVSGTICHPNKLALFLGGLLQLNLSCLFVRFPDKLKRYRWLCFLPLSMMLFTLLVSYSRSGWASFIAGGVINASWCMGRRTGKKIASIVVVFVVFASLAVMAFILIPSVRNRILMDDKGAAEVRKPLAQVARNVIYDKPWLGIGLNNYGSCYPEYDDTAYWVGIEFPHVVHNEWLLIAAESGIPAFLCFIFIISCVLLNIVRISRSTLDPIIPYLAIGFFCGVINWGIHSLKEFEYIMLTVRFWFNLGVMLAMILFLDGLEKRKKDITSYATNNS
ncbi:MAG: O-antigen ligase domain-containing protein, partial [Candidatus Electrothrix sp. ATG2]|nr:O-antigen ligase domain-containing protein [Candidatus Electrothrix sp. ATG2]